MVSMTSMMMSLANMVNKRLNIKSRRAFFLKRGAAFESHGLVRGLVDQVHEDGVLVLDVCLFLLHLALQDQIAQIAFLCEPDEELFEGRLYGPLRLAPRDE